MYTLAVRPNGGIGGCFLTETPKSAQRIRKAGSLTGVARDLQSKFIERRGQFPPDCRPALFYFVLAQKTVSHRNTVGQR